MGKSSKPKLKKPIKYPLVLVEWEDPVSHDPWTSESELDAEFEKGVPIVQTVGFLIRESEERIVVALNYETTNENFSCFIVIPLTSVVAFTRLKP